MSQSLPDNHTPELDLSVIVPELLSKPVFRQLNHAAAWSTAVTSIPSLNLIPVTTFAW